LTDPHQVELTAAGELGFRILLAPVFALTPAG